MSHQPLGLLATSEEAGLYIIVERGYISGGQILELNYI